MLNKKGQKREKSISILFIAIWKTFPPVNHKVLCKNTHTCQHGGF